MYVEKWNESFGQLLKEISFLMRPCTLALVGTQTHGTYILGICEARDSWSCFLPQRGQIWIRNHCFCHWEDQIARPLAVVHESVEVCRWGFQCWSSTSCTDPWVPSFFRDIPVRDGDQQLSSMFHHTYDYDLACKDCAQWQGFVIPHV